MTLALPGEKSPPVPAVLILPILTVAGYAAAEIALFLAHDPWRDEGQAWLWAREIGTLAEFFIIPGEGHPPLWFWLLRGLSTVMTFDQARLVSLAIAILNAALLARLLAPGTIILALVLSTSTMLNWWGFHFRPYGLVLTCVVTGLLLHQAGNRTAALWSFALACGLHFFAGLFFALYLLVSIRDGIAWRRWIGPAIVGAAFGLSAVLSGMNNPASGATVETALTGTADLASQTFPASVLPVLAIAALALGLVVYGLHRSLFILAVLIALVAAFAVFSAVIYSGGEWHAAFVLVLIVMAWVLAEPAAPRWPLALLLLPQAVVGAASAYEELRTATQPEAAAYAAIAADAGPDFDPSQSLVAWPDYGGVASAARHGFSFWSGNTGALITAIDWRTNRLDHDEAGALRNRLDTDLLRTHPTPYWLLCSDCGRALDVITTAGRTATEIAAPVVHLRSILAAYRIDD